MEERKSIEINNKSYFVKVSVYDDTKYLRVDIVSDDNKEMIMVTSGMKPEGATPDCVMFADHKGIYEKITKKFEEVGLLQNCNGLFGQFNINKLYEYDSEGTKEFLSYNASPVKKNEKNMSIDIDSITKDANAIFDKQEDIYDEYSLDTILKGTKDDVELQALFFPECDGGCYIIRPYANEKRQVDYRPEWCFSFDESIFNELEGGSEILQMSMMTHLCIWENLKDLYPEDIECKEGVQQYLKYCKEHNITKEVIDKENGVDNTFNAMKFYEEPKEKDKNKDNDKTQDSNKNKKNRLSR